MTVNSPVEVQQLELEHLNKCDTTSQIRPTHLTCASCKESLPIEQFHNDKTKHKCNYGKAYSCKSCQGSYFRQWRLKHPYEYVLQQVIWRTNRYHGGTKECDLDIDYLKQLDTTDICPILGIPMQWSAGSDGNGKRNQNGKSLDRIDSSQWYIKGNVQIISWRANKIKNNATFEELIKLGKWAETNL
jgi:hypothetical protein